MLYVQNGASYDQLRADLVDIGAKIISGCPIGLRSTETFLFFLDFIACPLVPQLNRDKLADKVIKDERLQIQINTLTNEFDGQGITVNWNDHSWLENNLLKREYFLAYE